jgi:hypothetical protein
MNIASYQRIIEACFPELQVHSAVPVSQGWDSVTLEVNDEYIFRFPKRPDVEPQYAIEALLLAELVMRLPIAVPSFQFVWSGGAEYSMRFVGYRKLAGVSLACDRHTPAQLAQLAEQLATFLSELHRFPVDLATQRLVPGGDPAIDFVGLLHDCGADFTERVLDGYRGAVDATFRQRMRFYDHAIPFHEILFGITIEDEGHIRQGVEALRVALSR